MPVEFFERLRATTPTRVWINNPTATEVAMALAQGADGCTTNPTYAASLLTRSPDELRQVLARAVVDALPAEAVAQRVQLALVAGLAARFRGVYEASGGRAGFVSIQGSPLLDGDRESILEEGRAARPVAPNVAAKIPATEAGLSALEVLVEDGAPTIVTEVFSVAQFVEACERYLAVVGRTGVRPPFFISPITGIFGDHLKMLAHRDGLGVPAALLELAGIGLARACYAVATERSYPVRLLCGGARTSIDLMGVVGGDLSVTVNWSTFAEALAGDAAPVPQIDVPLDRDAIDSLSATFSDVERALRPDGLTVHEFADFGPVRHFRALFVDGWLELLAAVKQRAGRIGKTAGDR